MGCFTEIVIESTIRKGEGTDHGKEGAVVDVTVVHTENESIVEGGESMTGENKMTRTR